MICKLCETNEADKKNTHYLTDGIIRSCLNEDGVNQREKGYMFDVSSNNPFIEFSFQRTTSVTSIISALGREPNEEEIAKAKQNAFSLDYIFCKSCEDIFTSIENDFIKIVLPQLRGKDLTGAGQLKFAEKILIRQLFLLQAWRTSVCDPTFKIPDSLKGKLQKIIIDKEITEEEISSIPLNITYLNTLGDDFEYTKNLVGVAMIEGNAVIFFNDFVIQVFESVDAIKYIDIYGINDKATFSDFANYMEDEFVIKVINNDERIEIASRYYQQEKVDKSLEVFNYIFESHFYNNFGYHPSSELKAEFINGIIYGKDTTDEMRYSTERFINHVNDFFKKFLSRLNGKR